MSISKQLIIMLGIAILGLIGVFSVGIMKMEQVYEKTNTCNVNSLPSILIMADLQENFYRMLIAGWKFAAVHDQAEMKQTRERYLEYKQNVEKGLRSTQRLFRMKKIEVSTPKRRCCLKNTLFLWTNCTKLVLKTKSKKPLS